MQRRHRRLRKPQGRASPFVPVQSGSEFPVVTAAAGFERFLGSRRIVGQVEALALGARHEQRVAVVPSGFRREVGVNCT